MEQEGEVLVEGEGCEQKNADKANSEDDEDLEANSGKEMRGGGKRKQKCRKKCPKTTIPVSEAPFPVFYYVEYCCCY